MKIINILSQIFRDFLLNSFWKNWLVVVSLSLTVVLNGLLWYEYFVKIKVNPNPFILASGFILIDLVLANYLWNREKLASAFVLVTILIIQIFMLAFSKYLMIIF
jgi:hypothetical protein